MTTVRADFGSTSAAEGARRDLVGSGVAEGRIQLANQMDDADRSVQTCRLMVYAGSVVEARRIAEVLEKRGARTFVE